MGNQLNCWRNSMEVTEDIPVEVLRETSHIGRPQFLNVENISAHVLSLTSGLRKKTSPVPTVSVSPIPAGRMDPSPTPSILRESPNMFHIQQSQDDRESFVSEPSSSVELLPDMDWSGLETGNLVISRSWSSLKVEDNHDLPFTVLPRNPFTSLIKLPPPSSMDQDREEGKQSEEWQGLESNIETETKDFLTSDSSLLSTLHENHQCPDLDMTPATRVWFPEEFPEVERSYEDDSNQSKYNSPQTLDQGLDILPHSSALHDSFAVELNHSRKKSVTFLSDQLNEQETVTSLSTQSFTGGFPTALQQSSNHPSSSPHMWDSSSPTSSGDSYSYVTPTSVPLQFNTTPTLSTSPSSSPRLTSTFSPPESLLLDSPHASPVEHPPISSSSPSSMSPSHIHDLATSPVSNSVSLDLSQYNKFCRQTSYEFSPPLPSSSPPSTVRVVPVDDTMQIILDGSDETYRD